MINRGKILVLNIPDGQHSANTKPRNTI